MSRNPVVLLIEDNTKQARLISQAIERLALPAPRHIARGEDAVLWIGAHDCDMCVLDYQLPGIDGLETLARMRQRKPDLPVVMLSNAKSERVAIAAFRAGVVDYVPKESGYHEAIASIVQQFARDVETAPTPLPAQPLRDVPEPLTRPSYQNRLRVIGRQLDLYGYRAINLLEVGGGFLVRALAPTSRTPEALEFSDRDFPQLLAGAIEARGQGDRMRGKTSLLPTGYEDFLRALGYRLDQSRAEAITVSELESFLAVGGVAMIAGRGDTTVGPFQDLMRPDDIAYLLEEAFQRRAKKPSVFGRLLGAS